ncbi:MAG TPA: RIP metalloprotease RseP, partial [Blastocatellia bacterium]|nr:RIP metalloprotease RseP [Blastocatellia bacterium]
WVLLSIGLMTGLPTSIQDKLGDRVTGAQLTITQVLPESPAAQAGIKVGDVVGGASAGTNTLAATEADPTTLRTFIENNGTGPITINVIRGGEPTSVEVTPKSGIVGDKPGIGVSMDMIGRLKLNFFESWVYGAKLTGIYLKHVTVSLFGLIGGLFDGTANLAAVTGPVGLVGVIGDAYTFGIAYVLSLAALISINLAIINMLPIPALDGGRLLFVIIEAIKGSPIKPKVAGIVNTVGFFALLLLMLVITVRDVLNLF